MWNFVVTLTVVQLYRDNSETLQILETDRNCFAYYLHDVDIPLFVVFLLAFLSDFSASFLLVILPDLHPTSRNHVRVISYQGNPDKKFRKSFYDYD